MENKNKNKKDFQGLGSRLKSEKLSFESGPLYNKCFPRSMYSTQYEEECPVNYSLKYSETETCKTNKTANIKLKPKDLADSDYTETYLDQPTDFSLKYGEKMSKEDISKNSSYEFYQNERRKFKSYTDYAETDLDQPTDFTLKYGESSDEEIKTVDFNYFKENKQKTSGSLENKVHTKELTNEPVDRHFMFDDLTPLMFSRSSSLNSLSSFEHNTHSIPDDRSSVVSDFSRTTSGLISPSELPDSPGQTEPSSPKRIKSNYFATSRGIQKKSVFEDDVATYKQEDTPVEFSRTTSLSSLNIENPVKQEFNLKTNSTASSIAEGDYSKAKEENLNCDSEKSLKEEILTGKPKLSQETTQKLLLNSEDEELLVDHIGKMTIQEKGFNKDLQDSQNSQNYLHDKKNCLKAFLNVDKEGSTSTPLRYSLKSSINSLFNNASEKVYATFEGSDDDVHTYHTEGTPANVSHAGSHSDLSSLSLLTGVVPSETEDNAEESSCVFEIDDEIMAKCKKVDLFTDNIKEKTLCNKITNSPPSKMTNKNMPSENQTRNTMINNGKANLKAIKQSNLVYLNCKEPQLITNGKNSKVYMNNGKNDVKSQSSCSNTELPISLNIENWLTESCTPLEEALVEQCIRLGRPHKNNRKKIEESDFKSFETREMQNWNAESCTPLEEALVEQCIRLGMPQKTNAKKLDKNIYIKAVEERQIFKQNAAQQPFISPKFLNQGIAYSCSKTAQGPLGSAGAAQSLINLRVEPNKKTRYCNFLNFENWAVESCTPLQEALVEQCIRLGQPNKSNCKTLEKNSSKGMEVNEDNHKMIPKKHSSQLKPNSTGEKSNELLKKSERFVCYSGRRLIKRRKKSKETCRRCKKHKEKQKNERSKF